MLVWAAANNELLSYPLACHADRVIMVLSPSALIRLINMLLLLVNPEREFVDIVMLPRVGCWLIRILLYTEFPVELSVIFTHQRALLALMIVLLYTLLFEEPAPPSIL